MAQFEVKDGVGIIPEGTTVMKDDGFKDCTELTSVVIPESVTDIYNRCFENCYNLSKIEVAAGNKALDSRNNCNAVIDTQMKALMVGCKNTVIPEGLNSIGQNAFSGCKDLKEIVIPDSVGLIAPFAFENCTGLEKVTLGKSLKELGHDAFKGCSSLTHITIPKSVMKIEDTGAYQKMSFFGCKNLKTIVVEEGNREFDSRDNCNAIIITNRNFHENELLVLSSSTIVPASVEKISQSAIQCPKNLHTISVAEGNPNFDSREECNAIIQTNSNILLIGSATTVIPESVLEIGDYAFWGNDELVEFTIPKTIAKIGKEAFRECQNLKAISILGPVALIDKDTFKDCASLETITFSTGIKKFHPEAFTNCTSIKTINVPAKKGDYYRTRLPEALRDLVVELPAVKKGK